MGEYKLDTSNTYITVDGHMCISVAAGIYKVQEPYDIDSRIWEKDERNRDLYAILQVKDPYDDVGTLLYIGKCTYREANKFMHELPRESDSVYHLLTCGPHDTFKTDVMLTLIGEGELIGI